MLNDRIMRLFIYCAAALVTALIAGSCSNENLNIWKGNAEVTFTVSAPCHMDTKAIADGLNVNELYYAVYKTEDKHDHSIHNTDASGYVNAPMAQGMVTMAIEEVILSDGTKEKVNAATVELELVKGQKFTVIFWAQVSNGYYELGDLRQIRIIDDAIVGGNDESRAAFYAKYTFDTSDSKVHDVSLERPFAQLNLGTDMESLQPSLAGGNGYDIVVDESEVVVKGLSSVFSTVEGKPVAEATDRDFTFVMKKTPYQQSGEVLTVQDNQYHYVSMNYLFVPDKDKLVTVSYKIKTDKGDVENTIKNVPVKQNFRTNIIGNLLTTKTKFEIVVDKEFKQKDIDLKYEGDGIVSNISKATD